MKGKFFIICILSVVTIASYLIVGCSNDEFEKCKDEIEKCKTDLKDSYTQYYSCKQDVEASFPAKISEFERKISEMVKQIDELSQTADGLWIRVTQCTNDECVEQTANSFIDKYPREPRIAEARKKISAIQKHREEYEKIKKENERIKESIARTESATIEEIKADPRTFGKSLFSREMCCEDVEPDEYVAPIDIAEINFRTSSIYKSICFWRWEIKRNNFYHTDSDTMIKLRLTQEQAKTFAKQPRSDRNSSCKYLIRGTVYFSGNIESGWIVMYLKDMEFQ